MKSKAIRIGLTRKCRVLGDGPAHLERSQRDHKNQTITKIHEPANPALQELPARKDHRAQKDLPDPRGPKARLELPGLPELTVDRALQDHPGHRAHQVPRARQAPLALPVPPGHQAQLDLLVLLARPDLKVLLGMAMVKKNRNKVDLAIRLMRVSNAIPILWWDGAFNKAAQFMRGILV